MSRAVFTVATGNPRYLEQALGLARSLSLIGDRTPRVLMTNLDPPGLARWFDQVVRPPQGEHPYLLKLEALAHSGADEVLFLDSDTIVFSRLEGIFERCRGYSFAARGVWATQGHWYGDVAGYLPRLGLDAIPKINGGLLFMRNDAAAQALIEEAKSIAAQYDALPFERFRGKVPDEPCVALAMARSDAALLIPDDEDVMNTGAGLVGKMHLDVSRNRCLYLQRGDKLRLKRPKVFHAADFVKFNLYWRQLALLQAFDSRRTDRHRWIERLDRAATRLLYGRRW